MGRLRILAAGANTQAQSQRRGKLFEQLVADVLRQNGYTIDRLHNTNYAGMEIDIDGKTTATDIPVYAECKCYETEIDAPKFHAFFGKYMTLQRRNPLSHGLFIALPGVNSHVRGFYRDNCETASDLTVRILNEDRIIRMMIEAGQAASPTAIPGQIAPAVGLPGDWDLLYTELGCFFAQYILPPGSAFATKLTLFNRHAQPVTDIQTVDNFTRMCPELADFEYVSIPSASAPSLLPAKVDLEEVVEVRGSSSYLEYQFPASPEFFIGRRDTLEELDSFVGAVLSKQTSSRGILFEANSGWGKSSAVLASVARLQSAGHFAVAIDCRTATSSQFILRVASYVLEKFGDFGGLLPDRPFPTVITGHHGAIHSLLQLGRTLQQHHRLLVIFLDQFENLFFLTDALRRIRDIVLATCDAQTHVIFGFSWKVDLVGPTSEFPYQLRDTISASSKRVSLSTFSDAETTAFLDRLSFELRSRLRKDLSFLLSEFSQGYPWLLKKLCAHVKAQRDAHVPQSELANSLLNVQELFQEDLRGLSVEEDDVLHRIAKVSPISFQELGEDFSYDVVQSLVNHRLLVRIGNKLDVYWDIFRDYLNSGRLPVQENYILRVQVGSVTKAVRILKDAGGVLDSAEFRKLAGLSEKSTYNVARDMRLLGLARVANGMVHLQLSFPVEARDFEEVLWSRIKDRLSRNRLVSGLLERVASGGVVALDDVATYLADCNPYISATKDTWRSYARIFAGWLDATGLARLDNSSGLMSRILTGQETSGRRAQSQQLQVGCHIPEVRYNAVVSVAVLAAELCGDNRKDVSITDIADRISISKRTLDRCFAALVDLGFAMRHKGRLELLPSGMEFARNSSRRTSLFAAAAVQNRAVAALLDVLRPHLGVARDVRQIGAELQRRLGVQWSKETAKVNMNILLDWVRCASLAPGIVSGHSSRNRASRTPDTQASLFQSESD